MEQVSVCQYCDSTTCLHRPGDMEGTVYQARSITPSIRACGWLLQQQDTSWLNLPAS